MTTQHNQQSLEQEAHRQFEEAKIALQAKIAEILDQLKLQKRIPQRLAFEENQADWERYLYSLQMLAVSAPDGGSMSRAIKWQVTCH